MHININLMGLMDYGCALNQCFNKSFEDLVFNYLKGEEGGGIGAYKRMPFVEKKLQFNQSYINQINKKESTFIVPIVCSNPYEVIVSLNFDVYFSYTYFIVLASLLY